MINKEWDNILELEYKKPYFQNLMSFVDKEYRTKVIYPKKELLFNAFIHTKFSDVKVVILGQDPYHGLDQANGLAFSVNKGIPLPPTLRNIFIELENDLNISISNHGDLTNWANQGVLLLNSVLTVEKNKPSSHAKKGWEIFTENVIKIINQQKESIVFILWGNFAKSKSKFIDSSKHLILTSSHPSPLSAYIDFFNSNPFSKTNDFLKSKKINIIDWRI